MTSQSVVTDPAASSSQLDLLSSIKSMLAASQEETAKVIKTAQNQNLKILNHMLTSSFPPAMRFRLTLA